MSRVTLGLLCAVLAGGLCLSARAQPVSADRAVQQAREAARADRHAEAIAAFGQALDAAPQRRQEWLLEWADQHTWAGRLDEAAALYRESIATLGPGERRKARIGLARALSWADRHDLALAQYQAVLRDHPGDDEAQRGIGRVQSWRGRHRDAAARMQQVLLARPRDREATLILAESLAWMGRADRARPLLREQVAADAGDARAAALLVELERERRPESHADWRHFDQSDGLRISEGSLASKLPFADGRGHAAMRYSLTRYQDPAAPANDIRVQRPGIGLRYRVSDALEWNGNLWLDMIDTRGTAGDVRRWTHDTYLTWWPGDLLRLDLSSSRWTFDSQEALRKGLTATQLKLSADLLPDELTRLTLRLSRADHSDGNRRDGWQLEAERRLWHSPRVHLGVRHTRYGFTLPGQGGYFNPDRYRSDEGTVQASGWVNPGLRWNLRGAFGREVVQPGDSRPIRSTSASLAWEADPAYAVEVAYDYSTSRTLSTGGFQRSIARVTLRLRH